jgi:glucose-6-phosphate 1-dehydrogenase
MVGANVELLAVRDVAVTMLPYERLLGDAMDGDPTLFAAEATVEASWRIVDPVLGQRTPVIEYERGSWGPSEADELTARHGGWHAPVA